MYQRSMSVWVSCQSVWTDISSCKSYLLSLIKILFQQYGGYGKVTNNNCEILLVELCVE